ncbi:hypothetical protein BVI2075_580076 [Burkholderia vietnamiensis]|nr:hypothetical protein BVI2075_580076 [Burkholderia vietnamiensis]
MPRVFSTRNSSDDLSFPAVSRDAAGCRTRAVRLQRQGRSRRATHQGFLHRDQAGAAAAQGAEGRRVDRGRRARDDGQARHRAHVHRRLETPRISARADGQPDLVRRSRRERPLRRRDPGAHRREFREGAPRHERGRGAAPARQAGRRRAVSAQARDGMELALARGRREHRRVLQRPFRPGRARLHDFALRHPEGALTPGASRYRKSDRKIAKKPLPCVLYDCQGAAFFLLKQRRSPRVQIAASFAATQQWRTR